MDLVLTGELETLQLAGNVSFNFDMTCFYRDDEGYYHLLSPYLRSRAEEYIMEQDSKLKRVLSEMDMQTWVAAVRVDLDRNGSMNPARLAWNVDRLREGIQLRVQALQDI